MPKSLDLGRLKQFEPPAKRTEEVRTPSTRQNTDLSLERWPSREPIADGQISIKGPLSTITRFKALCKDDRRTYADMLDILMDQFERKL